jgi:cell division protein FtsW (lipid II flippase)
MGMTKFAYHMDPEAYTRFFFAIMGHCFMLVGFVMLVILSYVEPIWPIACVTLPLMIIGYISLYISKSGEETKMNPWKIPSNDFRYILTIDFVLGLICAISGLLFFTTVFSPHPNPLAYSCGVVFIVLGCFFLHGILKLYMIFRHIRP